VFGICVYADRERWVSALEPLLYPTGVSFYRPFSYRAEYFVPLQLAEQLSDNAQRQALLAEPSWNEGFLGLRFRDEASPNHLPLFIPLRKVSLDDVEVSDGINLRFTLGNYVVPQLGDDNVEVLPSLDIHGILPNLTQSKLFIHFTESERAAASKWTLQERFPKSLWEAFMRALSPTASEMFRNTVVLRLSSISERRSSGELSPAIVDPRYKSRGYKLQESTTYDLTLSYYRLVQRGVNAPPVDHQYCITNPGDELQVSKRSIHVVGNYRAEKIWISPLKATEGPVEIAVEPARVSQPEFVADQTASKTVGLKLPVSIGALKWPGIRKLNFALFLVMLAASGGMLWWYFQASESGQKAILVVLASLLAVSVSALKDVLVVKR
jgi:hypothetical protein